MALNVQCPKCGSRNSRVVMSKETADGGALVRRRRCFACDHRWYGLQAPEEAVAKGVVAWKGKSGSPPVIADPAISARYRNANEQGAGRG